jgi:hypothetical protein
MEGRGSTLMPSNARNNAIKGTGGLTQPVKLNSCHKTFKWYIFHER